METAKSNNADIGAKGRAFANDPTEYFQYSFTAAHSIHREELEALQLAAVKYRFEQLYNTVPMVKKYADKQHFDGIKKLEDVVPMLFAHSTYKSYPSSLLENSRFDHLTRWLDKLTAHDLSGVDASGCEGITDWLTLLDAKSPLRISHSSGTTGTVSFIPFSKEEWDLVGKTYPVSFVQEFGDPAPAPANYIPGMHVVSPSYRDGGSAFVRSTDMFGKWFAGSEDKVHTLYPGRFDSDVLYLATRIRAAKANGTLDQLKVSPNMLTVAVGGYGQATLDQLKVSPQMLEKQKEFEAQQARIDEDMERFFEKIVAELTGKRVFIYTPWNMIYNMAQLGIKRGIKGVFSPDSLILSGGGAKGLSRPDNWQEPVCEFTGVKRMKAGYGMSESLSPNPMCKHGRYHFSPWAINFLLDPDTSELLPRTGVVTGRAAFYDLLPNSHWGGIITGDEVTVHWDGDCACGAKSAYIEDNVIRYSEKRGSDKIKSTAKPEAHKEAMDFLNNIE